MRGVGRSFRAALFAMKDFMDKDFLLETETAKHLYHDYAAAMPLADYHCHISPREIYEDRRFDNLAEVWLGARSLTAPTSGITTSGGSCALTACPRSMSPAPSPLMSAS